MPIYGHDGTIHRTGEVNIEIDSVGKVVSVWFRCLALPFTQTVVDGQRAEEMRSMSAGLAKKIRINAIDISYEGDEQ